jgi:hypothetical protein
MNNGQYWSYRYSSQGGPEVVVRVGHAGPVVRDSSASPGSMIGRAGAVVRVGDAGTVVRVVVPVQGA